MNLHPPLFLLSVLVGLLTSLSVSAQSPSYQLKVYDDQETLGILYGMTTDGRWGLIQNGSNDAGGTARPQVFNTQTGQAENRGTMQFVSISDDANITVGTHNGRPASYNHTTGKVTTYSMPTGATSGILVKVTPDGRWAVGKAVMGDEMLYEPLLIDLQSGQRIETPGLPFLDMLHQNDGEQMFTDITPDGRYVLGMMDDCYLGPAQLFTYIYDTQTHTYEVLGFHEHPTMPWTPLAENLYFVDGGQFTANGRYVTGEAYMMDASSEFSVPYRYDLETKEFTVFDSPECHGRMAYCADDAGTMLLAVSAKGAATPLRDFSVLYQDKYLISFATICQQYYGFDFFKKTGYENTGTPMAISADGHQLVAFSDPQGQSYWMDLGCSIEEACAGIDLLANYTTSPVNGAELSKLQTLLLNFDRPITVTGDWSDVALLDKDGNVVANAATGGYKVNAENNRQVLVQFSQRRPPVLTPGETYTLRINAGTISLPDDAAIRNAEIRLTFTGRENKPVEVTTIQPAPGSEVETFDANNYITLDFDSKILVTGDAHTTIQRTDGTIIAYLEAWYGNESGKGRVVLLPTGACHLYAGQDYEVVLAAGCITDQSGSAESANDEIRIPYTGSYQRPVPQDGSIFADNFNDVSTSLNTWLRYDGDGLTPNAEMAEWGFDAENQPWNFSIRETAESTDVCAASHSSYTPAGQSLDIMATPMLEIPNDDKVTLEFDAQSYRKNKTDVLRVLVLATDQQMSYISDEFALALLAGDEVFCETLSPGRTEGGLSSEWTHYSVNIGEAYKNRTIYIAFVNDNENQSAIFVDNVAVKRDVFYSLSFASEDQMVAADEAVIRGQVRLETDEAAGPATLTLCDAKGETVDVIDLGTCEKGQWYPFTFQPLPLVVGETNPYTIRVAADKMSDNYHGTITNLAFQTEKHVVLEEMTGTTCVNCPLGILTIEKLRKQYGERFIPLSIHTYTGDRFGAGLGGYTDFLGLAAAPSARINRLPEVSYPMVSVGTTYMDEKEGERLWRTVVAEEMLRLAPANMTLTATLYPLGELRLESDVTFALNYSNQLYNIEYVVMEDQVKAFQTNNLYAVEAQEVLGEWCSGGKYAQSTINPYYHDDVVRAVASPAYSGISGLIPTSGVAGEPYHVVHEWVLAENVNDARNVHVAALLINAATGHIENAAEAHLTIVEGLDTVLAPTTDQPVYNLAGQRASSYEGGIRIVDGKKMIMAR